MPDHEQWATYRDAADPVEPLASLVHASAILHVRVHQLVTHPPLRSSYQVPAFSSSASVAARSASSRRALKRAMPFSATAQVIT